MVWPWARFLTCHVSVSYLGYRHNISPYRLGSFRKWSEKVYVNVWKRAQHTARAQYSQEDG